LYKFVVNNSGMYKFNVSIYVKLRTFWTPLV